MNIIQKKFSRLVAALAAKNGNKIAIVEVPEVRNSPQMAQTINRIAGKNVCHFSRLLGCIVADDPDSLKKSIWDQWFDSSTKIVYLGA